MVNYGMSPSPQFQLNSRFEAMVFVAPEYGEEWTVTPCGVDHVSFSHVTSLLLEAERRKLNVLQRELQVALAEGGSIKAKEHQKQELIIAISWVPVKLPAQFHNY